MQNELNEVVFFEGGLLNMVFFCMALKLPISQSNCFFHSFGTKIPIESIKYWIVKQNYTIKVPQIHRSWSVPTCPKFLEKNDLFFTGFKGLKICQSCYIFNFKSQLLVNNPLELIFCKATGIKFSKVEIFGIWINLKRERCNSFLYAFE